MLDSVIRANKKYHPQTLFEDCKYEIKKNKMENLINDDFDSSSSDESENESDKYLIMNLIINLIIMNLMINLLKVKAVF